MFYSEFADEHCLRMLLRCRHCDVMCKH